MFLALQLVKKTRYIRHRSHFINTTWMIINYLLIQEELLDSINGKLWKYWIVMHRRL